MSSLNIFWMTGAAMTRRICSRSLNMYGKVKIWVCGMYEPKIEGPEVRNARSPVRSISIPSCWEPREPFGYACMVILPLVLFVTSSQIAFSAMVQACVSVIMPDHFSLKVFCAASSPDPLANTPWTITTARSKKRSFFITDTPFAV